MLNKHFFDQNFQNTSKILKQFLDTNYNFSEKKNLCLDLACGNGRNIFLLSSYFLKVVGVDICEKYLEEIEDYKSKYNLYNIQTELRDLKNFNLDFIDKYDFICISHYFEKSFYDNLSAKLKIGSKIYIETPTCRGGNYLDLPNESELNQFLSKYKVIFIKKTICKSNSHLNKGVSFTAILET